MPAYNASGKTYSTWTDYVKSGDFYHLQPDTIINLGDLTVWSPHYDHKYVVGQPVATNRRASALGEISVSLEEEWPLVGQRKLHATVRVDGIEPFSVMLVALRNDDPRFTFVNWQPNQQSPWTTLATQVPRDGEQQIMIGVSTNSHTDVSSVVLGTFDVNVLSDQPLVLDDDFGLVFADMLTEDDAQRSIYAGSQSFSRLLTPARFVNQLAQNYPNPFNPQTTLAFSIKDASDVTLAIYDVAGGRVRELVNEHRAPGAYKVVWDGTNTKGSQVASGVYFYKLVAGSFVETKKMVMLK